MGPWDGRRQHAWMWVPGSAGALAGMGQWCGGGRCRFVVRGHPSQHALMWVPGSAGALAGMGQCCGWGRCRFVVRGHPCPHGWGSRPWERRRPRRHGAVVWLVGRCRSVVRGHPCRHGWGGGESGRGRGFYGRGPPPPTRASHCDGIWECFRAHPTSFIPRDDDGPARAPALPGWCAAFPRQSTDWRASADLWSAGIPARMGGAVRICDMDGASMREAPTPYACLPLRRERGVVPRLPGLRHSTR